MLRSNSKQSGKSIEWILKEKKERLHEVGRMRTAEIAYVDDRMSTDGNS